MKQNLLFFIALLALSFNFNKANSQCTLTSPTVDLNFVQTNGSGNCVVNLNLGFQVDINNGNKIIFVHLWRTQDYIDFSYTSQNQPLESNVLANALATIVIDNDYVNNNPGAPASQVFKTSYGPDPGINDNTGAAQEQLLDASDGLTYSRIIVDAGNDIYRYTINNIQVTLPGACSSQISFTGDAWSSNANNANPSVQCSMEGYSFLVNDPIASSLMFCGSGSTPNSYAVSISTTNSFDLRFFYDVFVDNGDNFFDESLDIPVVNGSGPHIITNGSPYNSGQITYPAPYSTQDPYRQRSLWIRARDMSLTNNTANPPVTTLISNALLDKAMNPACIALPVVFQSFAAQLLSNCSGVKLNWATATEQNSRQFVIERSSNGSSWSAIGTVPAAGNSNSQQIYSYTDAGITNGAWQYRLREQDLDGREKLSSILNVKLDCGKNSYYVYPNPVRDMLTVQAPAGAVRQLKVYNATGQQITTVAINPGAVQTINTSKWNKGIYNVVITENGEKVYTGKIYKQ